MCSWLSVVPEHRISEYGELEEVEIDWCPLQANKEFILKSLNGMKSFKKLFSMKSETDDGLSNCSSFPERSTDTEIAVNKPILPEIEHLKCKISVREVLNRNADVFSKIKADIGF